MSRQKLVLLHGWGFSSEVFAKIIPPLNDDFDVQLIDLPGYGVRESEQFPTSLQDVAMHVVTKINGEDGEKLSLLGWSLGGLVAQQIAIDFPQLIDKLILVAATPCFLQKDDWKQAVDPDLAGQFNKQVEQNHSDALKGFYLQLAAMEPKPRSIVKEVIKLLPGEISRSNLIDSLKVLHQTDLRKQIAQSAIDILWIYGANDQMIPGVLEKISAKSAIKILDNAAHLPFLSQPQEFIQTVKQFISSAREYI